MGTPTARGSMPQRANAAASKGGDGAVLGNGPGVDEGADDAGQHLRRQHVRLVLKVGRSSSALKIDGVFGLFRDRSAM